MPAGVCLKARIPVLGKETEYKLEVGDLQLLDCILCSEPIASRM